LNDIGKRLASFYYKSAYFQTALTYCQKVEQTCGEAIDDWFYNRLGLIYDMFGKYDAALSYYEKELLIEQEKGDRQGEGTTVTNIGTIYHARGDYETALRYLEQSLEILREIGDRSGMCQTLFNMGHIHYQNNDHQNAEMYWVKTYRIAKEIGEAQALSALENQAQKFGGNDLSFWDAIAEKMGI
jgi:tetratricopeptide (TPR) repeat protein